MFFLASQVLAADALQFPDSIPLISLDDPHVNILNISDQLQHYVDPEGTTTIGCLVNADCFDKLEPFKREDMEMIQPNANYWSVMRLRNSSDRVINKFIALGSGDSIEVYRLLDGKFYKSVSGMTLPYTERAWYSTGSVIPVHLEPGAEYLYFIKQIKRTNLNNPFLLSKVLYDAPVTSKRARFESFIFGIQVVLVILGLLMAFIFKQRRYIYFVLPIIGFLVWFSDANGHFHLLFNTSPAFRASMNTLLSGWFMPTTVVIYLVSYLKLRQRSIWLFRLFTVIVVAMILASLLRYGIGISDVRVVNSIVLLAVLTGMVTSIYYAIKGIREAKIFLIFTAPLFVTGIFFLVVNLGFDIKITSLGPQTLMHIASLISSLVLTYVIYEKVSNSIKENIDLLEENKRLITEQNVILEEKVTERTRELEQEKDKSEQLLLNILPKETADELMLNGKAEPRSYAQVTVLFLDFVRFTSIAEKLTPTELVGMIDSLFRKFDEVVTKHNIEKIKTIGDAYLCAGGLPQPSETHAVDVIHAGMEMLEILEKEKKRLVSMGLPAFEARIGVHTGPVVAGVVGIKKFAYDIWGDTVNIAARMESNSEPGKLNISYSTYSRVKEHYSCTHRGKIDAKNKGLVDMFYVDDAKYRKAVN